MNGKLYGVSVGSGDPELITLKAVRIIGECDVIAVPSTRGGSSLALSIASGAVDLSGKEIIRLDFSMSKDDDKENFAAADEQISGYLSAGKDVAMLCLGDVSVYSTFSYISYIIVKKGFETVFCPGVTSFSSASARLGNDLVKGDIPLVIIPAGCENFDELIRLKGTKIIMKTGGRMSFIKNRLSGMDVSAVENCGLSEEKIYFSLDEIPDSCGYFTTLIVKDREEKN